jgi:hypothetical protein
MSRYINYTLNFTSSGQLQTTNLSAGTLNVSGGLTTGSVLVSNGNLVVSSGNLIVSGTISSASVVSALVFTGGSLQISGTTSTSNLVATTATIPSLISTNITTGTIQVTTLRAITGITTSTLKADTGITTGTLKADTGITTGTLFVESGLRVVNSTISNIFSTNVSSGTINASTGITSASLLVTGMITASSIQATTSTIPNILHTNVSTGTLNASNIVSTGITSAALLVTGLISSSSLQATSSTITNVVTTNISASTLRGIDLFLSGTLTTVNITTQNLLVTSSSSTLGSLLISNGNLNISSGALNATGNSNTLGNIFTTGGNVGIGTITPIVRNNIIGSGYILNSLVIGGAMLYPPTDMTAGTTSMTSSYGSGTYIATASTAFSGGESGYAAFDTALNSIWTTSPLNGYNSSTGVYNGSTTTIIDSVSYLGDWLQIQLPYTIQLTRYSIFPRDVSANRAPNIFYIAGSNNGTTWTMVDQQSGISGYTVSGKFFTVNSNILHNGFTYYRMVVNQNNGGSNGLTSVGYWGLYGSEINAGTNSSLNYDSRVLISPNLSSFSGTVNVGSGVLALIVGSTSGSLATSAAIRNTSGAFEMCIPGADTEFSSSAIAGDVVLRQNNTTKNMMFQIGGASAHLYLASSGNIGINTTSANAPLQFANTIVNRKLVLYDTLNNNNQYYGFGINASAMRYQVDAISAAHVFYAGTGVSTSNELLRISGTGNLTVAGTTNSVSISSGNIFSTNVQATTSTIPNIVHTNITTSTLNINAGTQVLIVGVTGGSLNTSTLIRNTFGAVEIAIPGASANFSTSAIAGDTVFRQNDTTKNMMFNIGSGAATLYIASSGNVGINTTSPSTKLDVNGTFRATSSAVNGFTFTDGTTRLDISSGRRGGSTVAGWTILDPNGGTSGSTGIYIFDGLHLDSASTTTLGSTFISSTLNVTGNVGINTTSPGVTLDVNGPIRALSTLSALGSNGVNLVFSPLNGSFGTIECATIGNTAKLPIYLNPYGGSIGIGNLSARASLEVSQITSSTTSMMLYSGVDDGGINRLILNHSANASLYQKVIIQTQALGSGHFAKADFGICVNTNSDSSNATFSNSRLFISGSSGNVGIGTTNPSDILQVSSVMLMASSGNLTVTGDVLAFGTISDQRLKENVTDISLGLETINNLRPVTFNWKQDIFNKNRAGTRDSGFIAQEVEQILEHAVSEYKEIETGEIYKNMRHERIIPYLVKAIQELTQQVNELRGLHFTT